MFCRKCGKEINDDSLFCRYCGAEVELINNESETIDKRDPLKGSVRKIDSVEKEALNTAAIEESSDVIAIPTTEEKIKLEDTTSDLEVIGDEKVTKTSISEVIDNNINDIKVESEEKAALNKIEISKKTITIVGVIIVALVVALVAIGFSKQSNSNQNDNVSGSEESTGDKSGVLDGLFSSTGNFIGTWYADKELDTNDEDNYFDRVSVSITINEDGTYVETINGDNRKGTWKETDKGSKILVLTRDGDDYSNETFEKHGDKYVLNTVYWQSFSLDVEKAPNKVKVPVGTWVGEKDVNDEYFDHLTATITVKEDGTYTQTISGDTRTGKWEESSSGSGVLILTRDGDDYSNETFEVHGEKHILNTVYWETLSFDMKEN